MLVFVKTFAQTILPILGSRRTRLSRCHWCIRGSRGFPGPSQGIPDGRRRRIWENGRRRFGGRGRGSPAKGAADRRIKMTDLKTRARILVLVILAALPALLFTAYSAIERRASEERQ